MKRVWMIPGVLALLFTAVGCGSKQDAFLDDLDETITEKIENGEIKSEEDLGTAMGKYQEDHKDEIAELEKAEKDMSDEEKKKGEKRMEELIEKWKKMIKEKNK